MIAPYEPLCCSQLVPMDCSDPDRVPILPLTGRCAVIAGASPEFVCYDICCESPARPSCCWSACPSARCPTHAFVRRLWSVRAASCAVRASPQLVLPPVNGSPAGIALSGAINVHTG